VPGLKDQEKEEIQAPQRQYPPFFMGKSTISMVASQDVRSVTFFEISIYFNYVGDVFFGMEKQNIASVSYQWIGFVGKMFTGKPHDLNGKITLVSGFNFPLNQSIDHSVTLSEIKMMGDIFFGKNGI